MSTLFNQKYGIFLFDVSPWNETNDQLFIGHTSWVKSSVAGTEIPDSHIVTVEWPTEYFNNYLKVGRQCDGESKLLTATLVYTSNDDNDLLNRKQYFSNSQSVLTPEHASRRANAVKRHPDYIVHKRSSRQEVSQTVDLNYNHEEVGETTQSCGVSSDLSQDEIEEETQRAVKLKAAQLEREYSLINDVASTSGLSPIGKSTKTTRSKSKTSRKRVVISSSSSEEDEQAVSTEKHDNLDSSMNEDDETSPRKLRMIAKLAKLGKKTNAERIANLSKQNKLYEEKDQLMKELLDKTKAAGKTATDPQKEKSKARTKTKVKETKAKKKFERLFYPTPLEKDATGENYILSGNVTLPIEIMDTMLVTPSCSPFVSKLMDKLMTNDEMRGWSLSGGTCSANNNKNIQRKQAMPIGITNAILQTVKKKYNILDQDILKIIANKLGNADRKK